MKSVEPKYFQENGKYYSPMGQEVTPRQILGFDPRRHERKRLAQDMAASQMQDQVQAPQQMEVPQLEGRSGLVNDRGEYQHLDFEEWPQIKNQADLEAWYQKAPGFSDRYPDATPENIQQIFSDNDSIFNQGFKHDVQTGKVPVRDVLNDFIDSGERRPPWQRTIYHNGGSLGRPAVKKQRPPQQAPMLGNLNKIIEDSRNNVGADMLQRRRRRPNGRKKYV